MRIRYQTELIQSAIVALSTITAHAEVGPQYKMGYIPRIGDSVDVVIAQGAVTLSSLYTIIWNGEGTWTPSKIGNAIRLTYSAVPFWPEDIYPDRVIDVNDLKVLAEKWLNPDPGTADIDGDEKADMKDMARLAAKWLLMQF